jgi:broad specificity phosphatase PhoE
MSVLILVRHGQASFGTASYDQLSEVGEKQAWLLGEYWARRNVHFDEAYCGPRLRQRHTAELVSGCYARAGKPFPEVVVSPDLDEYDLGGFMNHLAPALVRQDATFAELVQRLQQSEAGSDHGRSFQRMFEALTRHWQTTPNLDGGVESWPGFCDRVSRALRRLQDAPTRSRRVVLFTSGGFIGTAVHLALAAPASTALEVNWRIRNCSLTEFAYTKDRLTLDSFNAIPHLEDAEHWTYR